MRDLLVRAQELGGRWVSLGADAARGIVVENCTASADGWGPSSCSFVMRRKTSVPWPDIGPLAPLEIFDQGLLVWSGRVKGTPTSDGSDRSITVNGEGEQFRLDDDVFRKNYVQTRLADWVDQRTFLESNLANFIQGGQVSADGSAVTFAYPGEATTGTIYPAGACVGVTLDFGPTLCKRVVINWTSSNNAAIDVACIGTDTPDALSGLGETAFTFVNNSAASGSNGGTFVTARRYVHFYMDFAAGGTLTGDVWIKMNLARLFALATYDAGGGSSILKSSDIVLDAKSAATLQLSSDLSKVQASTFPIPDFGMTAPDTPRGAMTAANAYEGRQIRVGPDKLLEYRPLPLLPVVQVDARSNFDEASSGDSAEIYSGALVNYTDAAGVSQSLARSQPAVVFAASANQPTNSGAEANVLNWVSSGTLTRTTTAGQFTAGVAGFKLTGGAVAAASTSAFAGATWVAGQSYRLTIDVRIDTSASTGTVSISNAAGATIATVAVTADGTFHAYTLDWVQTDAGAPTITVISPSSGLNFYFDNLFISESAPTIVNRRGFRRTKILDTNMALTPAGAQQIADVFLTGHRTTPFKGTLTITGYGTASQARNGQKMSTAELLLKTGELVRLIHLVDPDTGALGREGRVASVTWDASSDTATIEIDSDSQNFDALLARLAIITAQVSS